MAAELRPLCGQMIDGLRAWSEYAALTTTAIHSPRAASWGALLPGFGACQVKLPSTNKMRTGGGDGSGRGQGPGRHGDGHGCARSYASRAHDFSRFQSCAGDPATFQPAGGTP